MQQTISQYSSLISGEFNHFWDFPLKLPTIVNDFDSTRGLLSVRVELEWDCIGGKKERDGAPMTPLHILCRACVSTSLQLLHCPECLPPPPLRVHTSFTCQNYLLWHVRVILLRA